MTTTRCNLPRRSTPRRRRSGFTLIELLGVMAAASLLMGMITATLFLMFRAERNGRQQFALSKAIDRLAEQFRRDGHEAVSLRAVAPEGKPAAARRWEFALPDGRTVRYQAEEDQLVRVERAGDRVIGQEGYALPPGATIEIDSQPDSRPPLCVLQVTWPRDETATASKHTLRIEAALGFAGRFSAKKKGEADAPKAN